MRVSYLNREIVCKCGGISRTGQRNCLDCHAFYMRGWRSTHPLTNSQQHKDNCRSYAGVYLRRGKLQQQPCFNCGSEQSQMHHPDYNKPLLITWLCRSCHLFLHNVERETLGNF